jgi:hypothetical protein
MASVTPRKKVLIPSHSQSRNGRKYHAKISYKKCCSSKQNRQHGFVQDMLRNRIPGVCFYVFSTEWNTEHFSPLRNGSERNSESFLFRGLVQKRIPRVCFDFCSVVESSEHSSLQNGSERNSESFLFRGTAGIPPEQTNCFVYSVLYGIIFFF